jgi:hypothetical protein
MFSKSFRFFSALSALSPILFSLWIVSTVQNWNRLYVYFPTTFLGGGKEFLKAHWALVAFACFVCTIYYSIYVAMTTLPHRPISIKKSKSIDYNFVSIVISCVLPFAKFFWKDSNDTIYLCAVLVAWIILALISMNGYQFNIIVRLMGYRYYEVETTDEMAFLLLSKKKIINKSDVKAYVSLTDHMIINV